MEYVQEDDKFGVSTGVAEFLMNLVRKYIEHIINLSIRYTFLFIKKIVQ